MAREAISQTRRMLERDHKDGPIRVPLIELRGADGPTLTVIAGLHGCEFAGIEAVRRLLAETDFNALVGSLRVVPIANIPAFYERSEAVVPVDNLNPNRMFPGRPDGSYTEVLADLITTEVLMGSDAILDIHGGDIFELLVPYSGLSVAGDAAAKERARELARIYDLPYVLESERLPGRVEGAGPLREAALKLGIPAVLHEAGGQGLMHEADIETHVKGIRNTLFHLKMLPGEPQLTEAQKFMTTDFWRTKHEGLFYPAAKICEQVSSGQEIGLIRNIFGDVVDEVIAPYDAEIIAIVTSLSCREDGVLYQVAH
jgi:predicted deacylase